MYHCQTVMASVSPTLYLLPPLPLSLGKPHWLLSGFHGDDWAQCPDYLYRRVKKETQPGTYLAWQGEWQEGAYVSGSGFDIDNRGFGVQTSHTAALGHKNIRWIQHSVWMDGGRVCPCSWGVSFFCFSALFFPPKHDAVSPTFTSVGLPSLLCQYMNILKFSSP